MPSAFSTLVRTVVAAGLAPMLLLNCSDSDAFLSQRMNATDLPGNQDRGR